MSKKNKMFRAWIHNYPDDGSERSAFEFGWRNGKKERARLAAENAKMEDLSLIHISEPTRPY